MSDTSIHFKDQGYTSPDFLTNLFKKPLYSSFSMSSFDTHHHSQRQIHSSTKQNTVPTIPFERKVTSPLKFKNQTSNTIKTYKSTPTIDQQKISNSKYKIFFKTFMHGEMDEQQFNQLWSKLEESLKNPFTFDKFIDQLKVKKEKEVQEKKYCEFKESLKEIPIKIKAKTPEKLSKRDLLVCPNTSSRKQRSVKDSNDAQKSIKDLLRGNITQLRQILLKGERIIRKKR